jgi:hypothetical protein
MPTSLVSTGVQFPDSTIQTTAAAAVTPRGATQVGSIVLPNSFNFQWLAANPAAQIASPFFSTAEIPAYSVSGSRVVNTGLPPKYSTYYGGWLTIASIGNSVTNDRYIFFSSNGVDWQAFVQLPQDSRVISQLQDGTAAVTVDDSNGRIFCCYYETAGYVNGFYYSSIPATSSSNTWTAQNVDATGTPYSQTAAINSMEYVKMSTTGASGIVFLSGLNSTGARIYTISAGGTTATLRASASPTVAEDMCMSWNPTFLRAAIVGRGWGTLWYSASDSITTWSTASIGASPGNFGGGAVAVSTNRVAVLTSTGLRYTSNFSAFTNVSTVNSGNTSAIEHNGTNWIAIRGGSGSADTGLRYSTGTDPVTWTRAWAGTMTTGRSIAVRRV